MARGLLLALLLAPFCDAMSGSWAPHSILGIELTADYATSALRLNQTNILRVQVNATEPYKSWFLGLLESRETNTEPIEGQISTSFVSWIIDPIIESFRKALIDDFLQGLVHGWDWGMGLCGRKRIRAIDPPSPSILPKELLPLLDLVLAIRAESEKLLQRPITEVAVSAPSPVLDHGPCYLSTALKHAGLVNILPYDIASPDVVAIPASEVDICDNPRHSNHNDLHSLPPSTVLWIQHTDSVLSAKLSKVDCNDRFQRPDELGQILELYPNRESNESYPDFDELRSLLDDNLNGSALDHLILSGNRATDVQLSLALDNAFCAQGDCRDVKLHNNLQTILGSFAKLERPRIHADDLIFGGAMGAARLGMRELQGPCMYDCEL